MRWGVMKTHYREAVDDLCDYVAEKYDGKGVLQFFFRDKEIVILGKEMGKVLNEDVLDWMADRWKIYLNVSTSVTGGKIRFDYWLSYIKKGELWKTPLEHGFESFGELFSHCGTTAIKAVNKRIKG